MESKSKKNQVKMYITKRRLWAIICTFAILVTMFTVPSVSVRATDVFVKGINLNGDAVTIDGNAWISYSAALSSGFSTTAIKTFKNSITWSPSVDTSTNTMLNSVIYQSSSSFTMNQTIANGSYKVYFWLTENYSSNARSVDIKLEGTTVATAVGKMTKNSWVKYGPYNVTVSDGSLTMDFARISGDPQCAGLAIFSNGSTATPTPVTTPTPVITPTPTTSSVGSIITNSGIETGNTTGWVVNGAGTLTASTTQKHSGTYSLLHTGRTSTWNGPMQKLTSNVQNGVTYTCSGWVKLDNATSSTVKMTMKKVDRNGTSYSSISTKTASNSSWIQLSGNYTLDVTGTLTELSIYFEGPSSGTNYYIDDISVTGDGSTTPTPSATPSPTPSVTPTPTSSSGTKPRVIITTDLGADVDDQESLVRLMVTANEFDIEGIISGTSCWKPTQSLTNTNNLLNPILNAYGQVVSNLQKHASGYPTLAYLKSVSKLGQTSFGMAGVGSGKDSAGSELIIAAVDKSDSRPVWVQLWGGGNTVAQALWKVKNTRSQAQVNEFVSKLRVYDILGQDDAGAWMTKNFPNLLYIRCTGVYNWQPTSSWVDSNIQNHGPLGSVYPDPKYAIEGDTPAFLYTIPNGLHDLDMVEQGGWGGRFIKKSGIRGMSGGKSYNESQYDTYYMYSDADGGAAISRWKTAINNDFAARMDWSIKNSYSSANHHPIAVVNNDNTKNVLQMSATAGSKITLSANGSSDPDGNALTYNWFYYNNPSSYQGTVTISNASASTATVTIPSGASGKTIHVILELHDNGSPNLYAYRRVIINVR
ncbi:nucleoside hydrolase-like domain-containing protein [Anaeromicropila populeti]|uniref:endo-1,4-beta-xylanase n=1 Tax=Anaeromicropila populeti TaxID=37658 RepID=A0A1I6KAZ5_9FIRM|nr:nucleoside hydrolase-like domain-containing protein [Anaeromicropila populeti]SFR88357.1 Carbohydrate binding domain-containing protein [Anaeromicropila populeti]